MLPNSARACSGLVPPRGIILGLSRKTLHQFRQRGLRQYCRRRKRGRPPSPRLMSARALLPLQMVLQLFLRIKDQRVSRIENFWFAGH